MSEGTQNYLVVSLIASLKRLRDLNAIADDGCMLIAAGTMDRVIAQLERLQKLEADLNHELTDEECEKLYKGLMEGEIHDG